MSWIPRRIRPERNEFSQRCSSRHEGSCSREHARRNNNFTVNTRTSKCCHVFWCKILLPILHGSFVLMVASLNVICSPARGPKRIDHGCPSLLGRDSVVPLADTDCRNLPLCCSPTRSFLWFEQDVIQFRLLRARFMPSTLLIGSGWTTSNRRQTEQSRQICACMLTLLRVDDKARSTALCHTGVYSQTSMAGAICQRASSRSSSCHVLEGIRLATGVQFRSGWPSQSQGRLFAQPAQCG